MIETQRNDNIWALKMTWRSGTEMMLLDLLFGTVVGLMGDGALFAHTAMR